MTAGRSKISAADFSISESFCVSDGSAGNRVYFRPVSALVTLDTPIYRYMPLYRLFPVIEEKRLYVPSRRYFTDLRDKLGLDKFIASDTLKFKVEHVPSYRDKKVIKELNSYKKAALDLCVSCWSMDTDGTACQPCERFLMWKAYNKAGLCCRIGTTIGKLIDQIESPYDIIISDVHYGGREGAVMDCVTFNKSVFYRDEREVRLVVLKTGLSHTELKICDPVKLLTEIRISPFVSPVLEEGIIYTLRRRYPSLKKMIRKSEVMEYE